MTDYEKLQKLHDQINDLCALDVNNDDFANSLLSWVMDCLRFLERKYGENSSELHHFKILANIAPDNSTDIIKNRRKAQTQFLPTVRKTFESLLSEFEEEEKMSDKSKNVFIVHGHDSSLKYMISNLIRKIGLNPIILHEQTNSSRTIIEKIEKYGSEAVAAVILFTPDDFGNVINEEERKARARQNVVFEAGYFMGLLGREKTVLIVSDGSIELPGDLSGVVYSGTNEYEVARELKAMGLDVDMNMI